MGAGAVWPAASFFFALGRHTLARDGKRAFAGVSGGLFGQFFLGLVTIDPLLGRHQPQESKPAWSIPTLSESLCLNAKLVP